MDVHDRVGELVDPVLDELDLELVDLEISGAGRSRFVRLYVDRDGELDLDLIARVSQEVSRVLDAHDPIPGAYTLEVSSPGVERPLRTPDHFRRVVGQKVSVKTHAPVDGERRHLGVLVDVDADGVAVDLDDAEVTRHLRFDQIDKARTVFEWGPAPKPGSQKRKKNKKNTKDTKGDTGTSKTEHSGEHDEYEKHEEHEKRPDDASTGSESKV